ncbi:hypothetical protein DAI22_04g080200 [Oryza sativa Japonica Group]|nr:hypothetical protein DAI22_04g080200 [Oryza sativa Japonica Group]KAF2933392.1 hypothetical protein DAI22_04g080200 [Oryza sativa Japonica Group]
MPPTLWDTSAILRPSPSLLDSLRHGDFALTDDKRRHLVPPSTARASLTIHRTHRRLLRQIHHAPPPPPLPPRAAPSVSPTPPHAAVHPNRSPHLHQPAAHPNHPLLPTSDSTQCLPISSADSPSPPPPVPASTSSSDIKEVPLFRCFRDGFGGELVAISCLKVEGN